MENSLARPVTDLPLLRTSARAVRVGTFAFETWSRLRFDNTSPSLAERVAELAWVAENVCALHGVRPLLRGKLPKGPSVLVANHVSYFDPLILASLVPCMPIAKREVLAWPLIGELGQRLGVAYVKRNDPASGARVLRECLRALENDVSVLVFPEGTTSTGESVLPFKRGTFGLAALADVPIIPVALRYERPEMAWVGDDAFLPHYARTMGEACTRVSVRVLEPVSARHAETAQDVAELARAAISRALRVDGSMPALARASLDHAITAAAV